MEFCGARVRRAQSLLSTSLHDGVSEYFSNAENKPFFNNPRRSVERGLFRGSVPPVCIRQQSSKYQRDSDNKKSVSPGAF